MSNFNCWCSSSNKSRAGTTRRYEGSSADFTDNLRCHLLRNWVLRVPFVWRVHHGGYAGKLWPEFGNKCGETAERRRAVELRAPSCAGVPHYELFPEGEHRWAIILKQEQGCSASGIGRPAICVSHVGFAGLHVRGGRRHSQYLVFLSVLGLHYHRLPLLHIPCCYHSKVTILVKYLLYTLNFFS